VNYRGIGGWGMVDSLTRTLIHITGMAITNFQAKQIEELYETFISM